MRNRVSIGQKQRACGNHRQVRAPPRGGPVQQVFLNSPVTRIPHINKAGVVDGEAAGIEGVEALVRCGLRA